jgi:hypothetical protein
LCLGCINDTEHLHNKLTGVHICISKGRQEGGEKKHLEEWHGTARHGTEEKSSLKIPVLMKLPPQLKFHISFVSSELHCMQTSLKKNSAYN